MDEMFVNPATHTLGPILTAYKLDSEIEDPPEEAQDCDDNCHKHQDGSQYARWHGRPHVPSR